MYTVGKEVKEAKHELGSCRYQQQSDFQYYPIQIKYLEKSDMVNLFENIKVYPNIMQTKLYALFCTCQDNSPSKS